MPGLLLLFCLAFWCSFFNISLRGRSLHFWKEMQLWWYLSICYHPRSEKKRITNKHFKKSDECTYHTYILPAWLSVYLSIYPSIYLSIYVIYVICVIYVIYVIYDLCDLCDLCVLCVCLCVCTIWIDVKLLEMSFIFSSTMQGATGAPGGRWPTKTPLWVPVKTYLLL